MRAKLIRQLWEYVANAIQAPVRERPELFDFTNELGGGSYKVLDHEKYINAVVANIHEQGVYNIWVSSGHVGHGPGAYITTCFPAQF